MGALVDDTQLRTVMGYIEAGRKDEGARCVAGGQQARAETGGFYVQPTVFDRVQQQHEDRARRDLRPGDEHHPLQDEAEAVALANASAYGLQASVWSDNINRAHRVARACAPAPCT